MHRVVAQKTCAPHLLEDTRFDPLLEAIVRGGTGAELGSVERFPLTAGPQDEEDGIHANTVVLTWPTAAETMGVLTLGQKVSDGVPEVVGDAPVVGDERSFHVGNSRHLRSCPEAKCSCTKRL